MVPLGGYSSDGNSANLVHGITVDGVHMDSFDITGVKNVTVKNSQVGPIDACFANASQAAANGEPATAACDPSNPVEAYWASVGGTLDRQDEPFVHNNGPDVATNVVFDTTGSRGGRQGGRARSTRWPAELGDEG